MRYILILSLLVLISIPVITTAGFRESFEKEFLTKPWAGGQIEEDVCLDCHSSDKMKPEFLSITNAWKASWLAQNNVSCHDCHGGDTKDASMAMSRQRGFVGTPKYREVPEFCGKCHIGILKNYLESGHGKALRSSGKGPNCVTCHGSHNIQKANIDIINERLCTKCHSYERAKIMKQALFITEKKIGELDRDIKKLKTEGVFTEEEEKALFSTQAEFRTLFHTVDASLVKERTDEFLNRLNFIEKKLQKIFGELHYRKNFSAFLMLLFIGLGIVVFLISRTHEG